MCILNALGWRKRNKLIPDMEIVSRSKEKNPDTCNYYNGFEAYVKPTSNTIYNRYKFQSKVQNPDETFEQFVTKLQLFVKDCEYDKSDEMVRERIVTGVRN